MPTLHIHFDESGDWSFTPKGSRYFILTAAWTYNPLPLARALTSLRFSLLARGDDVEAFHAAPNLQPIRNRVVETLLGQSDWSFASIVVEKRKVNPSIRAPEKFYPKFMGYLLRFILRGRVVGGASRVLVYADTLPIDTNARRDGAMKAIKTTCASELGGGAIPYYVYSHCTESNKWLQVADYCCWSVQRKWEKADLRTYDLLLPRLAKSELCVTDRGDGTTYY